MKVFGPLARLIAFVGGLLLVVIGAGAFLTAMSNGTITADNLAVGAAFSGVLVIVGFLTMISSVGGPP